MWKVLKKVFSRGAQNKTAPLEDRPVTMSNGSTYPCLKDAFDSFWKTAISPWGYYHCYAAEDAAREDFRFMRDSMSKVEALGARLTVRGKVQLRHSEREGEPNRWWIVILVPCGEMQAFLFELGIDIQNLHFADHDDGDMEFVTNSERKSTLHDEFIFGICSSTVTPKLAETETRDAAAAVIRAHLIRMIDGATDATIKRELRSLLEPPYLDFILKSVEEKRKLADADGKGHSKQFMLAPGRPFVSVSVWPCTLEELPKRFRECIGISYGYALPQYYQKAMQLGASSFCNILYCLRGIAEGVTATYCGANRQGIILPREFQNEFETST